MTLSDAETSMEHILRGLGSNPGAVREILQHPVLATQVTGPWPHQDPQHVTGGCAHVRLHGIAWAGRVVRTERWGTPEAVVWVRLVRRAPHLDTREAARE